jgi:RNA polymerase sigma-70 factor (ECF subfamily)
VQSAAKVPKVTGRLWATTTRWSLILSQGAVEGGRSARDALAELCQIYWRPIFTFIRHRGYSVPDAQDLTQDFFVMILKGRLLASADPNRGRFRCFLLKSLKNFLIDAEIKRNRRKRGGSIQFISWEQWMEEVPSQLVISAYTVESCPAETLFDLRWAATVAEQALRRLREECESRGHRRTYEALSNYLVADRTDTSYERLSQILGMPKTVITRLMHEFRARYRRLLREEVAETVDSDADIDDEIRYFCSILSAAG